MTDNGVQPLKTARQPLYLQAQQYLFSLIENGTYQAGDQLPPEADLAAQLGISRATLREALLNLEQEGLVVRKHGVGTFVAPGFELRLENGLERLQSVLELAIHQGLQVQFEQLQIEEQPANPELAEKLQVDPGTLLTSVQRVIVVGKRPVAFMADLVLQHVLAPEDVRDTFNGSVLDLLRQQQVEIAQAVADIIALNADRSLAQHLRIKPGQAVLLMEELLFNPEGTVIGFSRNYFVPDFFRFHIVRR